MNLELHDSPKGRVMYLMRATNGCSAQELATELGITVPGVRRHLCELLEHGLIEQQLEKPAGRGRPQHIYRLTSQGEGVFPKRYAELCGDILNHVQTLYGEGAILEVLSARNAQLFQHWANRLEGKSVAEKLEQLVVVLNEIGYQASLETDGQHTYLIEQNCPSLEVARSFSQLCQSEGQLYEQILGVRVQRESQISKGASVCRYRIG